MKKLLAKYSEILKKTPPHNIQKLAIGGLFVLLGFTFVQSQFSQLLEDYTDLLLSAVLPSVIVDLTNEERAEEDIQILAHSDILDETARRKALDMRDNEYFAHDSPDGVEPWYWFDEVGYDYVHAGENLAIYFNESEEIVEAWMESPLHKDNIMKEEYTEIGVAAVKGEYKGFDTVFVVQHFGTPAQTMAVEETETPEIPLRDIPEEPTEPTVVAEGNVENEPIILPAETGTPTLQEPTRPVVQEQVTTAVTQGSMTVYVSDHDATSTDKEEMVVVPATTKQNSVPHTKTLDKNTANIMNYLYILLATAVASILIVSTIHFQRHHRHVYVAYGVLLLLVTTLFMSFHTFVVEAFTLL